MDAMTEIRTALGGIETRFNEGQQAFARIEERLQNQADRMNDLEARMVEGRYSAGGAGGPTTEQRDHLEAFTAFLRNPRDAETRHNLIQIERRTASGSTDAAGGALVPEILLSTIFEQAKNTTAMRSIANVQSVSSGDVKFPISQNNAGSGWVGETDTRSATAEPTLLERKPTVGTIYSYVQASEELVYDSAFDVAGWFARSIADELALQEGTAFISGNGSNKPTGILNTAPVADLDASPAPDDAALLYIPTGEAGAFPNDRLGSPAGDPVGVLTDTVYTIKAQYRAGARWLVNSNTAKVMAKWKDGDGRPLWQPALTAGTPATLMGYPVTIDEAMNLSDTSGLNRHA